MHRLWPPELCRKCLTVSLVAHKKSGRYHPYSQSAKRTPDTSQKSSPPAWNLPLGARLNQPQNHKNLQGRLHPSLLELANFDQVSSNNKWQCTSPQEQLPDRGITCTYSKECSTKSPTSDISGFLLWTFLVPKPNNKWGPILDLSSLIKYQKSEKFKTETPKSLRPSFQTGDCLTSIDIKDAYFDIPIYPQSRKYLRFHVQGQSYQFKGIPFGLSTAPMDFAMVVREVKLMAQNKGIKIHQYLKDCLVRSTSHQACLNHTQILVA